MCKILICWKFVYDMWQVCCVTWNCELVSNSARMTIYDHRYVNNCQRVDCIILGWSGYPKPTYFLGLSVILPYMLQSSDINWPSYATLCSAQNVIKIWFVYCLKFQSIYSKFYVVKLHQVVCFVSVTNLYYGK